MSATPQPVSEKTASRLKGLKCRECSSRYDHAPVHVCELCFGPLEVEYDYDAIRGSLDRATIESREPTMWRYRELLPLDQVPDNALPVGFTPLVKANRLAERLGLRELYIKTDHVCHPTLSFKDRVVAIAVTRAQQFGFDTFACASTGNLANAVAAAAAAVGMKAYVFIPHDLESHKIYGTLVYGAKVVAIKGTYDEVNRLCAEIGDKYKWGFANVNLRPYYAEGSKTYAFEIAEQLGWTTPDNVVAPMAGGSLINKIRKAWKELELLGLLEEPCTTKIHGAQGEGCAPIVDAVRAGRELIKPVKQPNTIARSLAIGNPADGFYAVRCITETGGHAAAPSDQEIRDAMILLAETEGIFTETAGGVTLAATKRLIDEGHIGRDESTVLCITGQGLKTMDAITGELAPPPIIAPNLAAFETLTKE